MLAKKILAALTAVILMGTALVSCGEAERVPSKPIIESDAEVDTSPVELPESIVYEEQMGDAFDIPVTSAEQFDFEIIDGTVEIKRYHGLDSEVSIPHEIDGCPVTGIAAGAFANNQTMKALIIPDSVGVIGKGILAGCTKLAALETPYLGATLDAKEQYLGYLFGAEEYRNNPRDIPASLKLLRISGLMQAIPAYALYDCNDLICVELPQHGVTVEKFAFYNCSSLEHIVFSDALKSIGEYAFAYCKELKSIELGESTEKIGFAAFEGCVALCSMTLPFVGESLEKNTYLGYVFGAEHPDFARGYYPLRLLHVELLESCTLLGDYAFFECATLKEVVFPKALQSIGVRAFYGCTALWSVDLPDSLERIREAAFTGCDSLLSVDFGESLTSIGVNAFYDCDSLKEVVFPATLKSLPASCFARCLSLESVNLGGVAEVGAQAFRHCISIKTVIASGEVTFSEGNDHVKSVLYPEND